MKHNSLSERCTKEYRQKIISKFIPFLKDEKVVTFDEIKMTTLANFQDHLLARGMKPQTVNNNLKPVRKILSEMARKGIMKDDPGRQLRSISVREEDKRARGCYELGKLKGIFNRMWKEELSYLLCAIIYMTGMRNSEIKRLRMEDIQITNDCRFIHIKKSKTKSGKRMVPLHDFLYRKLKVWAEKNKVGNNFLFDFIDEEPFSKANNCLAEKLKVSDEELEAENITFYSGRHYWKTLMSAEGLGKDVEEIFMGHKVVADVAELYNHRDKRGQERLAEKATQVFSILDRCIFTQSCEGGS